MARSGPNRILLFALAYTAATVITYLIYFGFGERKDLDWTFWVEFFPQSAVLFLAGFLADSVRALLSFVITAVGIDLLFMVGMHSFYPEIYGETIGILNGSVLVFGVLFVILSIVFTFMLTFLGYGIRRLARSRHGGEHD